ncbi:cation-translocating P-type ATPase [Janthinobacterium sp.]|uniref:cation-translocating P-type ATPase n=1 Tax=Janthinobacterium sp. TaxID=1871054 RepID=UPI00293D4166|nr:cation-translocating P-type ATPase [Janthinobacterium sp.]
MTTADGLSASQAARTLQQDGYNELPSKRRRTVLHTIVEVMREPMFLLLLGAGAIYLLLGDAGDAAMLLGFVFVSMGITIVQERRTERVLETLRDLSSPRALVLRDGARLRIPGREVVIGDLLVLEEGDRVAADGELLECHDLLIDESLLTGESVAVSKQAGDAAPGRVFSGSMVVQGGGLARVRATGGATEIGKIGRALQALPNESSPLQREIGTLVQRFAVFGVAVSLLVFVLYGWTRHDWMNGLLAGITLAMSVLPEEFTVILTVFMALGAWRISKSQVLTRHTPVIEALGSASVLCVDKTGTLTQNRMALKSLVIGAATLDLEGVAPGGLSGAAHELLDYAVLASETAPFDPMDLAFHACLDWLYPGRRERYADWSFAHEYPLTDAIMAMTHIWRDGADAAYLVATKGAPEHVARLCKLDPRQSAAVQAQAQALAAQGMRVLAVARARYSGPRWPADPGAFDFVWLGLAGLADPLRPAVPEAVRRCREAGVRVVMITGDYPATAQAIARAAGLPADVVVTGAQLEGLDAAALAAALREAHVFARIRPEQKLRLVAGLKEAGEIVAMTGDGVNDAPALKAAHIGISMGRRGTDVAREASSLVLLDDDFSSIVSAIALGRRIYDNLRKALNYVVAVHLPIAGMTLLPLLFGTPLAFSPVHIVFLEMIINPACAIVFEAEEADADIMRRPPRGVGERLFGLGNVLLALLQGLGLLACVAAVFFLGLRGGLEEGQARAAAFTCVVIGNLGLIVCSRAAREHIGTLLRRPNPAQWWVIAGAAAALAGVLYLPALRRIFHFEVIYGLELLLPVLAGAAAVAWYELVKRLMR